MKQYQKTRADLQKENKELRSRLEALEFALSKKLEPVPSRTVPAYGLCGHGYGACDCAAAYNHLLINGKTTLSFEEFCQEVKSDYEQQQSNKSETK